MLREGSRIATLLLWASLACLIGGGILWSLSPVGVELSGLKFKTPDVFWKLFPLSPALLFAGLIGLYLWRREGRSTAARIGLWAAFAGSALIVAGDVGLFHLGVDDTFIMAAPAYRAFRGGLVLLAAGALLFGGPRRGAEVCRRGAGCRSSSLPWPVSSRSPATWGLSGRRCGPSSAPDGSG